MEHNDIEKLMAEFRKVHRKILSWALLLTALNILIWLTLLGLKMDIETTFSKMEIKSMFKDRFPPSAIIDSNDYPE